MEKKAPPCQILRAAPWQNKGKKRLGPGDTHPFGSLDETTTVRDLDPEEVRALFWDKDKAKTPTREESERLAAVLKDMQEEEE